MISGRGKEFVVMVRFSGSDVCERETKSLSRVACRFASA